MANVASRSPSHQHHSMKYWCRDATEENIDAANLSPAPATLAALGCIFAAGAGAGPHYSAAEKRRVEIFPGRSEYRMN